jgi:hypothetical protein
MALWQGTAFNSNESAMVVNQLAENKTIPMVVKNSALLYALMGKMDGSNKQNRLGRRSTKITGKKVEIRLLGTLADIDTVSDGANEIAAVTGHYDADLWGGAEFELAHYYKKFHVPNSEWLRFRGDEAKTRSYIGEHQDFVQESYTEELADAIHEETAPSRSHIGGWRYAIDDNNTYGTLDRSDSGNVDFRGYVNDSFGDLTLAKMNTAMNYVRRNQSKLDIGVTEDTLFGKLQMLVQPYSQVVYSGDTAKFGAPHVNYAGVDWLLDHRTASGVMGIFDSRDWRFITNAEPFTSTGYFIDPGVAASRSVQTELWCSLLCVRPNRNVRLSSVT